MEIKGYADFREKVLESCGKVIVGKDEVIEKVLICFLVGGHVLLEDVPGTGKTMLLRAFAKTMGCSFNRIQFTPDVMPSDLTGLNIYNMKNGEFEFHEGPLFSNMILADEINRATPRTQSALLEAMEEKQITVDGHSYSLAEPYMVMATQNPIDSSGTFPLPEAQKDRFLMKLSMGYMSREEEISILGRKRTAGIIEDLNCVTSLEEIEKLKTGYKEIEVSDDVKGYIMDIVSATRNSDHIQIGASTRGTQALYECAQAKAALAGRAYCIPEDVKELAPDILGHRIVLGGYAPGRDGSRVVAEILEELTAPVEKIS